METLDVLNDKQHSESFDQPKSTSSKHIEELDQAKVYLQTEDENQNMSMRRNNFEVYN